MRKRFDRQLEELNDELIQMGSMCETALASASKALLEKNKKLAYNVLETENEIDHIERDIESLCLKLLLQQQPVATDLRNISSALKIITDLERIGDQASDISEIAITLSEQDYIFDINHVNNMFNIAVWMVTKSIEAYVYKSYSLAQKVIEKDDAVDCLFIEIKNDLISLISEDRNCGEQALDFLIIAKYLERIADHATNVAEWVEFSITGSHPSIKKE